MSYDAGDVEVVVEWFQRDISGGEERRIFKAWEADEEAGDAGPETDRIYTFNSTELRMLNVEMVLVPPVRSRWCAAGNGAAWAQRRTKGARGNSRHCELPAAGGCAAAPAAVGNHDGERAADP